MSRLKRPRAVLIAGPTASGKSAFAAGLARAHDGVIVNADSMQVYAEMRVLTARPSPEDEALVPHRLYGHVAAREAYSVARWLGEVRVEIEAAHAAGRLPVIVGGTGLYFKALLEGLSPVPAIPDAIRARWRQAGRAAPAAELHAELVRRDPLTAAKVRPSDRQRLVRALEVMEATGRPLAAWQAIKGEPVLDEKDAVRIVVDRPRAEIVARCEARFRRMVDEGALVEAGRMAALQLEGEAPAMRALGLQPLIAHLQGEVDIDTAVAAAVADTRAYVKRQQTWLRRYMIAWKRISEKQMTNEVSSDFPIIDQAH